MRPTFDEYFIEIAKIISKRSTCLRRQVGCVLVDSNNHILSTGYNGVAANLPHCNFRSPIQHVSLDVEWVHPYACEGSTSKSGEDLELCEAIHSEQNALLQCHDVTSIYTAYCTTYPCIHCMKLLSNTSVKRIVYEEKYYHQDSERLAKKCNIEIIQVVQK